MDKKIILLLALTALTGHAMAESLVCEIDSPCIFYVTTANQTSEAKDADSPPDYRIYEGETATPLTTGTMSLLDAANTDGFYSESFTPTIAAGYEPGKQYSIYVNTTIDGAAGTTPIPLYIVGVGHNAEQTADSVENATASIEDVSENITYIRNLLGNVFDNVTELLTEGGSVSVSIENMTVNLSAEAIQAIDERINISHGVNLYNGTAGAGGTTTTTVAATTTTVSGEVTFWVQDQLDRFGDYIQIHRNDSESNEWVEQRNISKGSFQLDETNGTYVFQLAPDKAIPKSDPTNPNWISYQIFDIVILLGAFLIMGAVVFLILLQIYIALRRRS